MDTIKKILINKIKDFLEKKMKNNYFDQDEADNDDILLNIVKERGDVPKTCLNIGVYVYNSTNLNENPCESCDGPRHKCHGYPKIIKTIKKPYFVVLTDESGDNFALSTESTDNKLKMFETKTDAISYTIDFINHKIIKDLNYEFEIFEIGGGYQPD